MTAARDYRIWDEDGAFVAEAVYPVSAALSLDPPFAHVLEYVRFYGTDVCYDLLHRMAPGALFHVIDTVANANDPGGWTFERYGVHDLDGGRDYTGTPIGAYPNKTYANHLQSSYVSAVSEPSLSIVMWSPDGTPPRLYLRLIIPCENGKLFIVSRLKECGVGLQLVPHFAPGDHGDVDLSGALNGREIIGGQAGVAPGVAVDRWKRRLRKVTKNIPAVEVGLWLLERYCSD